MERNETEIVLNNGYAVQLFEYERRMILSLTDDSGTYISETKLSEAEINKLEKVIAKKTAESLRRIKAENELLKQKVENLYQLGTRAEFRKSDWEEFKHTMDQSTTV